MMRLQNMRALILATAVVLMGLLLVTDGRAYDAQLKFPANSNRRGSIAPRQARRTSTAGWVLPVFGAQSKTQQTTAKKDLLDAIAPLKRGLTATDEEVEEVEKLTQKLEKLNPNKKSLASPLINGRWELLYTTSASILGKTSPAPLRPNGPIYQDIDAIGLRAKNSQYVRPLPFVRLPNSVRAALTPTSASAVDVQFLEFRVGPIKIKAPESAKGALDTTFLDEEIRVSRGDKGNLFVLVKTEGQEPDFS